MSTIIAIIMACSSSVWSNPGSEGVAASQGEIVTFPCVGVSMHKAFLDAQGEAELSQLEGACQKLKSGEELTVAEWTAVFGEDTSPAQPPSIVAAFLTAVMLGILDEIFAPLPWSCVMDEEVVGC